MPYGITPDPDARFRQLEEQLREAALAIDSLRRSREPLGHIPLQVRKAVTCTPSSGSYPVPGDNCYPIVFVDPDFTNTPGLRTLNATARQAAQATCALSASTSIYIPINTPVDVYQCRGLGGDDAGEWFILGVGEANRVVRFRLSADLSTGGNAAAAQLSFNGTTYVTGGTIYVFDWYAITGAPTSTRGMFQGKTNMEGIALRREVPSVAGHAEYDIIWMEQYAWDCEVTLTSNPTFSGTAYASSWSATADVDKSFHQGISPGSSITIYDDTNPGCMYPFAKSGAKAKVIRTEYEASQPYYKVVVCQQLAIYAAATLSGALCGGTPATVENFTVKSPSPFNLAPAVLPTSVGNTRYHAGLHGDEVHLHLDANPASAGVGNYYITDIERHAISVLQSIQMDAYGIWLQGCSRTAFVEICDTTPHCTNLMMMRWFNWWCSGNYWCSGSLGSGEGSGSGGSGGGGGDTICGCATLGTNFPTLTGTIIFPGTCWDGQNFTLTYGGTGFGGAHVWTFSGTLLGQSWTIELRCSGDLVNASYLHVEAPACITGAPGDLTGPGIAYSCEDGFFNANYGTMIVTAMSDCGGNCEPFAGHGMLTFQITGT